MKFQKFVKAIGTAGTIYVRKNDERWLASGNVLMRIPDTIRSITAEDILPMPDEIENTIRCESFSDPCSLHKAVMPCADGSIKDCVRIYATDNALDTLAISNSDYALLQRGDMVEMYVKVDSETEEREAKALMVKEPTDTLHDPKLVGVIFPTRYEEVTC